MRLELLGRFRLSLDGVELKLRFAKTQALLSYLALTGRPHSREALADLLWGEHPEDAARASLRVALSELRRILPEHLDITRGAVSFKREQTCELDLERLSAALRTPDDPAGWRAATAKLPGELLEGVYLHAPVFEAWLAEQRETLRGLLVHALRRLAAHDLSRGDHREAAASLGRLLALEPWREEAHRQLMLAFALTGQREAAVAQYLGCCRVLAEELGLEPGPETTRLYERIRAGELGPSSLPASPLLVAERRQLSILSCELLGLGALADPEELQERLGAYHRLCAQAVARFEGFVAGRQGPLMTAYFGYPLAHEDDARRAVHAGLELLKLRAAPLGDALRVGVHTGAVVGRDFSLELLAAASPIPMEALQRFLDDLVGAGLIHETAQRRYSFKHALIRDAAYASLLKRERQDHHARVAGALAAQPEVAEQPELLAQHYGLADEPGEAVRHWQGAAAKALAHSAHQEAVHHLSEALRALAELPETEARREQELELLLGLGAALHAAKGYAAPEVQALYRRAHALCSTLGDSPRLFTALAGLAGYSCMRAQYAEAWERVEQMLALPQHLLGPLHLVELHFTASRVRGFQGHLRAALAHAEQAIHLPDPPVWQSAAFTGIAPEDAKMSALGFSAMVLWLLGYPDRSLEHLGRTLKRAEDAGYLYMRAASSLYAVQIHLARREPQAARAQLERLMALASEFSPWLAYGEVWQGLLRAEAGQTDGLSLARQVWSASTPWVR